MNSYGAQILNSERPGSSARVYDYVNSNYEPIERRSKIPKLPKRTYSLEGKKSAFMSKKPGTRNKTSTTSMIPRPEWKKQARRTLAAHNHTSKGILCNKSAEPTEDAELPVEPSTPKTTPHSSGSKSVLNLESTVNKELISFTNSVLRIPEYWSDAGETVTSILKNAVTIITKQYPAADVASFEKDIENILKATDTVKRQILTRTECIINKANQIYAEKTEKNAIMADEDIRKLTKKISDLKSEVYYRKNVFGDLLKYGSEMKELLEIEKSLKQKAIQKENSLKESSLDTGRNDKDTGRQSRHPEGKKSKVGTETVILSNKKSEKHSLQSCGDIVRLGTRDAPEDAKAEGKPQLSTEDKETQTIYSWCDDLYSREKDLKDLNRQVAELNQLCKDHISKFKNFNLQIKMRGLCNKAQSGSGNKDIYNDEKIELVQKKSNLACYNKDLESAIKQKDLDFHNNERMLHQKKKLLNVRDELIGMLKNRCSFGEQRRY